jgi:hypothetical protein
MAEPARLKTAQMGQRRETGILSVKKSVLNEKEWILLETVRLDSPQKNVTR